MYIVFILIFLIFTSAVGQSETPESTENLLDEEKMKFFSFEEEEPISEEKISISRNFQIDRLLIGDFLPQDGKEILIVEKSISFGKNPNHFKLSFASTMEENLEILSDEHVFDGTLLGITYGVVDSFGNDKAVIHWRTSDGVERIHVLNPWGGLADDIFPGRTVPKERRESIAVADMDGDGIDEIVVPSFRVETAPISEIDKIIVFFNRGDHTQVESYAIIPAPVMAIEVANIDSDNQDEILTLRCLNEKTNENAIWAIKRLDNGTYIEKSVATSSRITLLPPEPINHDLYYFETRMAGGQYNRWIINLEKDGEFGKLSETKLYPDGLILGYAWGRFFTENESSLAIITNESLENRKWLTVFTPMLKGECVNQITMMTSADFFPKSNYYVAFDTNDDGIDELLFIDSKGSITAMDMRTSATAPLAIKRQEK